MVSIVVICGPSNSGKTTVGRAVAKALRYSHWEMSDYATTKKRTFEEASEPISTLDFVEHVLWPEQGPDAVADPLLEFISEASLSPTNTGVVVTGPRRFEEIEQIRSLNQPDLFFYLVVPFATRLDRARRRTPVTELNFDVDFAHRTQLEASWGLLGEPVDSLFHLIPNTGPIGDAAHAIETLVRNQLPM